MKFLLVLLPSLFLAIAEGQVCNSNVPRDLCEVFNRLDAKTVTAPYFWSRTADRLLGIPRSINIPDGLLCYDAFTGGQPKNPDLCRKVAPTICEWGEDMSGRIRCYEHYEGRMVGGGPINDYLCRLPALCTRENLAAEDHFY